MERSINLQEIFNSPDILHEILKAEKENIYFIHIDIGLVITESKVVGFFQLLLLSLLKVWKMKGSVYALPTTEVELVDNVRELCSESLKQEKRIVFVVQEFETVKYEERGRILQGLANILYVNRNHIHAVLNFDNTDTLQILENDIKLLTFIQNIVFVPLPSDKEITIFIDTIVKRWNIKLGSTQNKLLLHFRGNKFLTKAALRVFRDKSINTFQELIEHREIKLKLQILFNKLGLKEKELLQNVTFGKQIKLNIDFVYTYLMEIGVIQKNSKRFFLKPPILSHLIKINNRSSDFDIRSGEILYGVCNLSNILSGSEYRLLQKLYTNRGEIISRDEVAEVVWGSRVDEQYSDWALDKLISRIRSKFKHVGIPLDTLVTYKSKGVMLK